MKYIRTCMAGLAIATVALLSAPIPALADAASDNPKDNTFQIVPCTGTTATSSTDTTSKDCDFAQLIAMVNRIIKFLLYLSIPLVLGIIMYTAFKYLTANGDPGKLADAKRMLIPVALGIFWVLAAYIVVYTVLDKFLADSYKQGSNGIINSYFSK